MAACKARAFGSGERRLLDRPKHKQKAQLAATGMASSLDLARHEAWPKRSGLLNSDRVVL